MMSALVLQFERNAMILAPPFNKAGLLHRGALSSD